MEEHQARFPFNQPLCVDFGSSQRSIRVASVLFRRMLRTMADCCLETQLANSRKYPLQKSLGEGALRTLYTRTLLGIVTLPVDGIRSTKGVLALIHPEFVEFDDGLTIWDRLRSVCLASQTLAQHQKHTRLARIDAAAGACATEVLRHAIQELDATVALQLPKAQAGEFAGHVGTPIAAPLTEPPEPWRPTDPFIQVARDFGFFGRNQIHPANLNNVLVLGGTGSGKTESVLMPLLSGLLKYELNNGKTASILVIDPKRELSPKVRSILSDRGQINRFVTLGDCPPVQFFAPDSPLSANDRLCKLGTFGPVETADGDHTYWRNLGLSVLGDILQLEYKFGLNTGGVRLIAELSRQLRLPQEAQQGFWPTLRIVLAHSRKSRAKLKATESLLRKLCSLAGVKSPSTEVMAVYTGDDELLRQWAYACQSCEPLVNALSDPVLNQFVDLDPYPSGAKSHTDIAALMEHGKVIVFCPENREAHRVAGKAIKQKVFEFVFARRDMERPIGVVVDEAQRFITGDAETGEQNFLDRCRAYRAITVLASQSIASLTNALGSNNSAKTTIEIVFANCPTKFILRSTDAETKAWLRTQVPYPTDSSPHVLDVRPPSGLKPGEAYYLFADGSWGRDRACLGSLDAATAGGAVGELHVS
jgi:hypothetical protein